MNYSISPAETKTTKALQDAGYKILDSNIEFVIGAVDDTDVYKFLYLLMHGFPGQVTITDIDMSKQLNLTQPLIRNIGMDAPHEPLVRAIIVAQWRSMVPDTSFVVENEGGQ